MTSLMCLLFVPSPAVRGRQIDSFAASEHRVARGRLAALLPGLLGFHLLSASISATSVCSRLFHARLQSPLPVSVAFVRGGTQGWWLFPEVAANLRPRARLRLQASVPAKTEAPRRRSRAATVGRPAQMDGRGSAFAGVTQTCAYVGADLGAHGSESVQHSARAQRWPGVKGMFAGSASAGAAWKTGRRPNAANTIPQTSPPAHVLAPGRRTAALRRQPLVGTEALDFLFSRRHREREHAAEALGVGSNRNPAPSKQHQSN